MIHLLRMPAARYAITVDVGSTFIKATSCQIHQPHQPGAVLIRPTMVVGDTVEAMIDDLMQALPEKISLDELEVVIIGHPPDSPTMQRAPHIAKYGHEEVFTAAVANLSTTSAVLCVDIGAQRTLVGLGKYGKASVESFPYGVGDRGWEMLRHVVGIEIISAWVNQATSSQSVEDYIANKSLYGQIVPASLQDLAIEQAMAKAILSQIAKDLPIPWEEVQQVVLSGSVLSQAMNVNQSLSILLDGLQPIGTMQVSADTTGSFLALSGVSAHWFKEDARRSKAMLHSSLTSLGTIICLGTATTNKQNTKLTLDTGLDTQQILNIRPEELLQIPLPQSELSQVYFNHNIIKTATGGQVGIVVDSRSRPILLQRQPGARLAQLKSWDKQLNTYQQVGQLGQEVA